MTSPRPRSTHRRARRRAALCLAALALVAAACADDDGGSNGGAATAETQVPTDTSPAPDGEGAADAASDQASPTATDANGTGTNSTGTNATGTNVTGTNVTGGIASVTVEPSEYVTIAARVEVVADQPVQVEMTATSGDHVVDVPRTAAVDSEHVLPLAGMRAEREYDIDVALFDADGEALGIEAVTFTTGALPDDFVDYEFEADPDRSSPGYTLIEMSPDGLTPYLLALDAEGEVVWYYRSTGRIGGVETTDDGTFMSFYWPLGVREFDLLGNVAGNWQFQPAVDEGESVVDAQEDVIDDDLLQQFLDSLEGNPGDPEPVLLASDDVEFTSIHHESWPMPNGNILTVSTTFHDLTPEQRATFCPDDTTEFGVVSDVIVEFERSGRVVRTWDLWDAVDVEEVPGDALCGDTGPFASGIGRDWMHVNAAVYDEERDAIIVSSRHTSQVIALAHGDEEGPQSEVLWILGQSPTIPLDGDAPYYQHAPEVQEDGSILLYDNGNTRPGTEVGDADAPTYSRAVVYEVDDTSPDPADWTAAQVWEHRTNDADGSPLYARFLGDADRLENGNVLVTHGGIDLPDDDDFGHALIIEVVPDGESGGDIVWRFAAGTPETEVTVYRSERIPGLYFGPDWVTAG